MQRLREEAAGTSVSMQFSATRKTVDTDYKAELHFRKMIFQKLTPRVWHIPDTSTVRILGDGMPIVCPNDAFEVG